MDKLKKPTKAEVKKAKKIIERDDEWRQHQFMRCQCPEGLKNGDDGWIHRAPFDCCTDLECVTANYNHRIKHFEDRKKEVVKSYDKKIKKLISLKNKYAKAKRA